MYLKHIALFRKQFQYQDLLSLLLLLINSFSVLRCNCVVLFLNCPLNAYVYKTIGGGGAVRGRLVVVVYGGVNAGESVTQDSVLVLVFKGHQVQFYFQHSHICRIVWGNSWGVTFFFF